MQSHEPDVVLIGLDFRPVGMRMRGWEREAGCLGGGRGRSSKMGDSGRIHSFLFAKSCVACFIISVLHLPFPWLALALARWHVIRVKWLAVFLFSIVLVETLKGGRRFWPVRVENLFALEAAAD